uniref:Uncharacterized protein n=1 Tax=Ciona savignyi TaxID=51511 RepID=H2YFF6_CIOSA
MRWRASCLRFLTFELEGKYPQKTVQLTPFLPPQLSRMGHQKPTPFQAQGPLQTLLLFLLIQRLEHPVSDIFVASSLAPPTGHAHSWIPLTR